MSSAARRRSAEQPARVSPLQSDRWLAANRRNQYCSISLAWPQLVRMAGGRLTRGCILEVLLHVRELRQSLYANARSLTSL